ncbi:Pfs, NACHT and WD domain protein [Thelonectria olida]|uniref:Mitochondrial division protein 1 n=1 Tax=Thelonectria olida TaxID=1576542 RepID=A0A9P8VUN8_9HYPO|nr:Pfs, NACHT and WD domain protein [Thelonectria olida]
MVSSQSLRIQGGRKKIEIGKTGETIEPSDVKIIEIGARKVTIEANNIAEIVTNNHVQRDHDDDRRCLADLRVTDPQIDMKRIMETKGGLLEDSYRWILTSPEFRQWYNHDEEGRLLWIKGDPGKGKTMLVCGIINKLSPHTKLKDTASNRLMSYFFCEAGDERTNTATSVLRGLLYLLAKQEPSLLSHIRREHDTAGKALFEGVNAWSTICAIFTDVLTELRSRDTYLIIDALDECKVGLQELLHFVVSESSSSPRTKWIISSRNWPRIIEILDTAPQKMKLCLELKETAISEAVNSYIRHKVNRLTKRKKYSPKTTQAVQKHFSSKAQNTFLWVALACQMLQDTPGWAVLKQLGAFPTGLNPLYGRMIQQVCDQQDDYSAFYQRIIAIMLTVFRPITFDELRPLEEKIPDSDKALEEIVDLCGSFLRFQNRTIYFVHDSAKQFLMDSPMALPSYAREKQHHAIFLSSLRIMNRTLRRDIMSLGPLSNGTELAAADPLACLRYSCVHWVGHLMGCGSIARNNESEDHGPIHRFLREKYLYWLEALGHMKSMSVGILSMRELDRFLQSHASQLANLVRDESQFIRYHGWGIENSPLQVYDSALVFSPARSITRQIYKGEEPEWISMKPAMQDNWRQGINTLEGHPKPITSIAFSHDGRLLASASMDRTAKIWDVVTGECIQTLRGHTYYIQSIAFSGTDYRIASASGDRMVKVWDAETAKCIWTLEGHTHSVVSVAFSQDSNLIASGSVDGTIKLWNPRTGTSIRTLEKHTRCVTSVAFSQDGHFLASMSSNWAVTLWDPRKGICLRIMVLDCLLYCLVTFSPDNKLAVSENDKIVLCDPTTGKRLQEIQTGHGVSSFAFSQYGHLFTSSSSHIKVWDMATQRCIQQFQNGALSVAVTPAGHLLASTDMQTIEMRDLTSMNEAQIDQGKEGCKGHTKEVLSISFSPNGSFVASACQRQIKLWDSETGECVQTLNTGVYSSSFTFSPNSLLLATWGERIVVWETATGAKVQTLRDEPGAITFSHDNRWLVYTPWLSGTQIKVWDWKCKNCIQKLGNGGDTFSSVTFSRNGRYLAAGGRRVITFWDPTTWQFLYAFKRPSTVVSRSLTFSDDSLWLVESSMNETISVWDMAKEKYIRICETSGEFNNVVVQTFDPVSSHLQTNRGIFRLDLNSASQPRLEGYGVSADYNWIIRDAQSILWLPAEYRPRTRLCLTPDGAVSVRGSKIAIGSASGQILILGFSPEYLSAC